MKSFGILVLLLAALTAVVAIRGPHAFGLLACGDDDGCLSSLYGRAIMGSSSAVNEMTTVTSAPTSSSDKTITSTINTYTTVPCSEDTDTGTSTTTVSKHTTSTDFITVTITSSSTSGIAATSSTTLILSSASISITASTFSSSSTSSVTSTSSTVSSSGTASSTSSVSGASTSASSSMAYVPPSYELGSTTGLPTYSGISIFSSTSSVDALSANPLSSTPAVTTIVTQSIIPVAVVNPSSPNFITLTSSSTNTRTTTINIGLNPSYTSPNYNGAISSVLASMSLISNLYHPTAVVATLDTEEACSAFSTVYFTVTTIGSPALPTLASGSGVPANPLYSQLDTSASSMSSSSAASGVGAPQYESSTDALSSSIAGPTTITSNIPVLPTAAASNSTHPSNGASGSASSSSPFLTPTSNTSNTAPTACGNKHINIALVLCFVGALVMFAV